MPVVERDAGDAGGVEPEQEEDGPVAAAPGRLGER
jgi:hypothetical protein